MKSVFVMMPISHFCQQSRATEKVTHQRLRGHLLSNHSLKLIIGPTSQNVKMLVSTLLTSSHISPKQILVYSDFPQYFAPSLPMLTPHISSPLWETYNSLTHRLPSLQLCQLYILLQNISLIPL